MTGATLLAWRVAVAWRITTASSAGGSPGALRRNTASAGSTRPRRGWWSSSWERGLEGATILEIGGGVGEIEIELLKSGAARAENLELSPAYDEEACKLAEEAGVAGRLDRRIHDIAAEPAAVEPADVVVLHRVVCCYPDYERLLGAAADHARRALVFSYPPRNVLYRAFYGCFNFVMWMTRSSFRGFAHPPTAMRAVLERHGLRRTCEHAGRIWQMAGHEPAA